MSSAKKATIIYTASSYLQKALGFLLLPLYTHYLAPSDYGILSVIQSYIMIMGIFCTLSLNGAASRFYYDGDKDYVKKLYGTITLSVAISSVFVLLFCFLVRDIIFEGLGNIPISPYFIISTCSIALTPHINIYLQKIRMEHRAIEYAVISFSNFLTTVSLTIGLVVFAHFKSEGVLLSSLICNLFLVVYIAIRSIKEYDFTFVPQIARKAYSYSLWLVPHSLAGWTNQFVGKILLANMSTLQFTGIYSVGERFSLILSIFVQSFNMATAPTVLKAFKDNRLKDIARLGSIIVLISTNIALWISVFSKDLVTLVSSVEFHSAWTVIPMLLFGVVFNAFYMMTSSALFYDTRATRFLFLITVSSAFVNAAINVALIPHFGIMGSAFATMVSAIIINTVVTYIANRFIRIHWEYIKIYGTIVVMFVASHINFFLNVAHPFDILIKLTLATTLSTISMKLFGIKKESLFFMLRSKTK